jgi:tellurite resistance protein TerC
VLRLMRRFIPMTNAYAGHRFFVRDGGKVLATPMLAVLLAVETTDVIFALDSIPAVFGVTRDPFIVYTSNIFAILGLRALYFVLAGFLGMLRYLKHGLALVLAFVGVKMLVADYLHVPVAWSLGAIFGILAVATVASIAADRRERRLELQQPTGGGPLP